MVYEINFIDESKKGNWILVPIELFGERRGKNLQINESQRLKGLKIYLYEVNLHTHTYTYVYV